MYLKFPTPLINRLEKHFVLTSSILEKWQETVLDTFVKWITDFSKPRLVSLFYIQKYSMFLLRATIVVGLEICIMPI